MDELPGHDLPEVEGDVALMEAVEAHWEPILGPISNVLHEIISEHVHLDIHQFERPWRKGQPYITTGMAQKSMIVPPDLEDREDFLYAELLMVLPPTWPRVFSQDYETAWPFVMMKQIARFPHEFETWICDGHSVGGDGSEPPFPGTGFNSVFIMPLLDFKEEETFLVMEDGRRVNFYGMAFLYPEELHMVRKHGSQWLYDRLREHRIFPHEFLTMNPNRVNVAKSEKKGLFGWLKR